MVSSLLDAVAMIVVHHVVLLLLRVLFVVFLWMGLDPEDLSGFV